MKKLMWIPVFLGLLLCGCANSREPAAPAFVLTDLPQEPIKPAPYTMVLPQAEQLVEVARTGENVCWEAADGSCYAVTLVTEDDADTALLRLTGFDRERLRPVEDQCWGMPRSRFCWTTRTEEGTYLCQGQILADRDWRYCLAVCCREDADGFTRAFCTQAFTGFGLYTDEGA